MQTLLIETCDWKKTSHSRTHLSSDVFKLKGLRHEVQVSIEPEQVLHDDLQGSQESGSISVAGVNTVTLTGQVWTQVLSRLFKI